MAEYKSGFNPKHTKVQRRDYTGKYSKGKALEPADRPRRKVGDVDPEGKKKFEAELARVRRPSTQSSAPKKQSRQEKSKPETTYRKSTGALRTRKERIDYEVEKAVSGG